MPPKRHKKKSPPKRSSSAAAADTAASHANAHPPHDASSPASAPKALASHEEVAVYKSRFMAPFAVYDAAAQAIVPNPLYDRAAAQELSRAQGALLAVLRQAERAADSRTPRELLFELERGLLYAAATTAAADPAEPMTLVAADAAAVARLPVLEARIASREAPPRSVAALAYVCSTGVSGAALTSFLEQLGRRLRDEGGRERDAKRTAAERAELRKTSAALDDAREILADMRTAFGSLRTAGDAQRRQPVAGADSAEDAAAVALTGARGAESIGELLSHSYLRLVSWLVSTEEQRAATRAAAVRAVPYVGAALAAAVPGLASHEDSAAAAAADAVTVTHYDPVGGHLTLTRPNTKARWGLQINSGGELSNVTAASDDTPEAAQLRKVLSQVGPRAILEVNGTVVRDSPEETPNNLMNDIVRAVQKAARTLRLRLAAVAPAQLESVQEVHFEITAQGGEGAGGQCAQLVLRRPNANVKWGLIISRPTDSNKFLVDDTSPHLSLSEAAQTFLFEHRRNLEICSVNDVPVDRAAAKASDLLRTNTTVNLLLRVRPQTPAPAAAVQEVAAVSTAAAAAEEQTEEEQELEGQADEELEDGGDAEETAAVEEGETEAEERPEEVEEGAEPEETVEELEGEAEERPEIEEGEEAEAEEEPQAEEDEAETDEAVEAMQEEAADVFDMLAGHPGVAAAVASGPAVEGAAKTPKQKGSAVEKGKPADALPPPLSAEEREAEAAELEAKATPKKRRTRAEIQREAARKRKEKEALRRAKAKAKREALRAKKLEAKQAREAKKLEGKGAKTQRSQEEEAVEEHEEEATAAELAEKPLLKSSKSSAEAAIEAAVAQKGKNQKKKKKLEKSAADGEAGESTGEEGAPVPLYQLVEAPPLQVTQGGTTIAAFNGETLEVQRPSPATNWNLLVKTDPVTEDVFFTGFKDPNTAAIKGHPFARALGMSANGGIGKNMRYQIISCNGQPIANASDFQTGARQWKRLNKLKFLLRPVK